MAVFSRGSFWLSIAGMLMFAALCAAATAAEPPQDWKIYNGHNLSLRYPDGAQAYNMGPQKIFEKLGCGYDHGDIIFCMIDTQKLSKVTATITVSLRSKIRTESDCTEYSQNGKPENKAPDVKQTTINGIPFYQMSNRTTDQGKRHMTYDTYRAFNENTCYEILSGYSTPADTRASQRI